MAHLWTQGEGGWCARELADSRFDLATPVGPRGSGTGVAGRIIRADAGGVNVWALIISRDSDARVNSREVPGGLCILADRDEIRAGGKVQYFSTETLAAAEAFPGAERTMFCGRCRQQIEAGALAVCCPGCGVWYNQSPGLPCWTYSDKCVFCGCPTALDSGFAWTPEEG